MTRLAHGIAAFLLLALAAASLAGLAAAEPRDGAQRQAGAPGQAEAQGQTETKTCPHALCMLAIN